MLSIGEDFKPRKDKKIEKYEKFIKIIDNLTDLPSSTFIMVNEYDQNKSRGFLKRMLGKSNDIEKIQMGEIYEDYISLAEIINEVFKYANTIIVQKKSFGIRVNFELFSTTMVIRNDLWESIKVEFTNNNLRLVYGDYKEYENIKEKVFDLARIMLCYKTFFKLVEDKKFIINNDVYFMINNISENNYPTFTLYINGFGTIEVSMVDKKIKVNSFSIYINIDEYLKKNYVSILSNCYIQKSIIYDLLSCFDDLKETVDYISKNRKGEI